MIKRTVYVNDCVFSDSSTMPVSLEHAFWLAEEKNSLKDWDASKVNALCADTENVQLIIKEKDEALAIVTALKEDFQRGVPGITPEADRYFRDRFEIFEMYVKGFRTVVQAIILTKYQLAKGKDDGSAFSKAAPGMLTEKLNDLLVMAEEFTEFGKRTSFQHTVYILLDPERLVALHDDLIRKLNQACAELP